MTMKINIISLVFFMLVILIGCAKQLINEELENVSSVQESVSATQGPCNNKLTIEEEMNLITEEITTAEAELDGRKIDLEFARQDNEGITEAEDLVKLQEDYITELNNRLGELQNSLEDC